MARRLVKLMVLYVMDQMGWKTEKCLGHQFETAHQANWSVL
jgi:hypothetical protein